MDEMVDVEEKWFSPNLFRDVIDTESGVPMAKIFPDGLFVRRLAKVGTVLEAQNATREEAEAEMFGD